jgi:hypothetical protein
MTDWPDGEPGEPADEQRWAMAPADLLPRERWLWWEQLFSDVIALSERYRISPAKGWWENPSRSSAGRAGRLGRRLRLRRMG